MKYFNDYKFLWKHFRSTQSQYFEINSISNIIENLDVKSIMDIGCGNGDLFNNLQKLKTIGIDTSVEVLDNCKADVKLVSSLPLLENVKEKADIVTCIQVMEHIPRKLHKASLKSINSRTNKYCLIASPFLQNLRNACVKCPNCGTVFQCEGHIFSFNYFNLLHFQKYLGKLKYLYFWGVPRRFGNITSTLINHYDLFKTNINQRIFNRYKCTPPFTKCPECNYKMFYDYENYKNKDVDNEHSLLIWDYSKEKRISRHFIAIYEKGI